MDVMFRTTAERLFIYKQQVAAICDKCLMLFLPLNEKILSIDFVTYTDRSHHYLCFECNNHNTILYTKEMMHHDGGIASSSIITKIINKDPKWCLCFLKCIEFEKMCPI
jgi:hypothetical protein